MREFPGLYYEQVIASLSATPFRSVTPRPPPTSYRGDVTIGTRSFYNNTVLSVSGNAAKSHGRTEQILSNYAKRLIYRLQRTVIQVYNLL